MDYQYRTRKYRGQAEVSVQLIWNARRILGCKKLVPDLQLYETRLTEMKYQSDNLIWMALQPALQLVTRIINTDHPFWMGILDMMNRKRVSSSRDPLPGSATIDLVSVWKHLNTLELPNEARVLEYAGWHRCNAVAQYLEDRVELNINSALRDSYTGSSHTVWGITYNHMRDVPAKTVIRIDICAEMIWPLLVPMFTSTEKASVSLMIASTLLHEFAVRVSSLPCHREFC